MADDDEERHRALMHILDRLAASDGSMTLHQLSCSIGSVKEEMRLALGGSTAKHALKTFLLANPALFTVERETVSMTGYEDSRQVDAPMAKDCVEEALEFFRSVYIAKQERNPRGGGAGGTSTVEGSAL